MKVFFTCSTKNIEKHEKFYRAIRDEIIKQGHRINRDWIDYPINIAKRGLPRVESHKLYQDVMTSIITADAVVVDATVPSMAVGHQLAHALQNKKPTLILRYKERGKEFKKLFIEGSSVRDLEVETYQNQKEIRPIIKKFFNKYETKAQKRFNLVLSGSQNAYIRWAAFHYKKTKTDIIHEAIDKTIEKDELYKKYLSK